MRLSPAVESLSWRVSKFPWAITLMTNIWIYRKAAEIAK